MQWKHPSDEHEVTWKWLLNQWERTTRDNIGATECLACLRAETFKGVQKMLLHVHVPGLKTFWTSGLKQKFLRNQKKIKYFRSQNEGIILDDGNFDDKKQPTSILFFLRENGFRIYFEFWDIWATNWKKFRQLFPYFCSNKQKWEKSFDVSFMLKFSPRNRCKIYETMDFVFSLGSEI